MQDTKIIPKIELLIYNSAWWVLLYYTKKSKNSWRKTTELTSIGGNGISIELKVFHYNSCNTTLVEMHVLMRSRSCVL